MSRPRTNPIKNSHVETLEEFFSLHPDHIDYTKLKAEGQYGLYKRMGREGFIGKYFRDLDILPTYKKLASVKPQSSRRAKEKSPLKFNTIGSKNKLILIHAAFRKIVQDPHVLETVGYTDHNVEPHHIHKSKTDHQIAIDILTNYILKKRDEENGLKEDEPKTEIIPTQKETDTRDPNLPDFAKERLGLEA